MCSDPSDLVSTAQPKAYRDAMTRGMRNSSIALESASTRRECGSLTTPHGGVSRRKGHRVLRRAHASNGSGESGVRDGLRLGGSGRQESCGLPDALRHPHFHASRQRFGRGSIDYRRIFEAATRAHLEHALVEQEELDMPPMEALKIDANYMRALAA